MKKSIVGSTIVFFLIILVILEVNTWLQSSKSVSIEVISDEIEQIDIKDSIISIDKDIASSFDKTSDVFDTSIHKMYLTVFDGYSDVSTNFEDVNSFDYINNLDYTKDSKDIFAYAYLTTDPVDEYKAVPNCTIEVRGQSSRKRPQKSYKIKTFDDVSWFGNTNINLNKHFDDELRIKNKLTFDIFKTIPDLISFETKFVELYVRDLASDNPNYVSYGLYTFIEQPNKDFLEKSLNDRFGALYKAEFFEFLKYDVITTKSDIFYDEQKFEELLEIRGNDDHEGLVEMLTALNDFNNDIDDVVEEYFSEENLLTWLAATILTDNYDSNSRNYMIYSPLNSSKWYFLPWDYDKGWRYNTFTAKWQTGISNYWNIRLFNRYFRKQENIDKFLKVFDDTYEYFKPDIIGEYIEKYKPVALEYTSKSPDFEYFNKEFTDYFGEPLESYESYLENMKYLPEKVYKEFYANIGNPMPFFMGDPIINESNVGFVWEPAVDFQNDDLSYDFYLYHSSDLDNPILEKHDIIQTGTEVEGLSLGTYFWRVIAVDDKGNTQVSFDYEIVDDRYVFGVRKFEVK